MAIIRHLTLFLPCVILDLRDFCGRLAHCVLSTAAAAAKSLQLCPILCDPTDRSPAGSSIHGVLQARTLEWVATPSSRGSSWPRNQTHISATATAAKSLQSCPTLYNPIDSSPPGSPVPGILQARILEWVAISFSNVWRWKVKVKSLSPVRLWVTPWTAAYRAPPSMGFSRREYWSRVPSPSPTHISKVSLIGRWILYH